MSGGAEEQAGARDESLHALLQSIQEPREQLQGRTVLHVCISAALSRFAL